MDEQIKRIQKKIDELNTFRSELEKVQLQRPVGKETVGILYDHIPYFTGEAEEGSIAELLYDTSIEVEIGGQYYWLSAKEV